MSKATQGYSAQDVPSLGSWDIGAPSTNLVGLESSYRELKKKVVASVSAYADYAVRVQVENRVFSETCRDLLIGSDAGFENVAKAYSQLFAELSACAKQLPRLWRARVSDSPAVFLSHKDDETFIESDEYSGRLSDANDRPEYAGAIVLVADFVAKKLAPSEDGTGFKSIEDEIDAEREKLKSMLRSGKR